MADLYDQLEELRGMTRLLAGDVMRLRDQLGELSPAVAVSVQEAGARRAYARAVFALIEAFVEQHKRLLLHLNKMGKSSLGTGFAEVLSEKTYGVNENGTVSPRDQFVSFKRKIRAVYRAAGHAFENALNIDYDGKGWDDFGQAILIRDRITHPKTFDDLDIDCEEVLLIQRAEQWYRTVSNEFVRAARIHKENQKW